MRWKKREGMRIISFIFEKETFRYDSEVIDYGLIYCRMTKHDHRGSQQRGQQILDGFQQPLVHF